MVILAKFSWRGIDIEHLTRGAINLLRDKEAKLVLDAARREMASDILAKRDIDTYIGQVKNAREAIPYSYQTLIWSVFADLEDDLVELKKLKEKNV